MIHGEMLEADASMQTQQLWSVKEEELPVVARYTGSHRKALLVAPHLQTFRACHGPFVSPPDTALHNSAGASPSFVRAPHMKDTASEKSCRGALTVHTILQQHGDLIDM